MWTKTLLLISIAGAALAQPEPDRIQGLRSRSAGGFLIEIRHSFARDSADSGFLMIPKGETRQVDIRTVGPGGLDQGSAQARRSYALWLISNGGATQGLASLSFNGAGAAFPPGTTMVRRIGSFATDSMAQVIGFRQIGSGNEREVHYKKDLDSLNILDNGRATTFTFVPFGHLAPVTLETVLLSVVPQLSPVTVRTDSSVEQTFSGPGVGNFVDGVNQGMDYRNQFPWGRTDISVIGYSETL